MKLDALLEILLNVVIPCALALAGGILAARSLSDDKRVERSRWMALLYALPALAIVLAFVQQVRISSRDEGAKPEQQAKDIKTEGDVKYTQGELDSSLTKCLLKLSNANSLSGQPIAKALIGKVRWQQVVVVRVMVYRPRPFKG